MLRKVVTDMKKLETYDISVEEFDALEGHHDFSQRYQQGKKKMLTEYKKGIYRSKKYTWVKVAAAFLVVAVSGPLVVNAATGGDLFARIWGNQGKQNIKSHEEVVYSDDKDEFFTATYPQVEYEELDVEKAEKLIGDKMEYPSLTTEMDGTTITILSAVRDKNSAVVAFTMEKEGGVDAISYSQIDNEAKGAYFTDEARFWFSIGDGGKIFVDLVQSTADTLYCYYYIATPAVGNSIAMVVDEYPCTRGERERETDDEKSDEIARNTKHTTLSIPIKENVENVVYTNDNNGYIELSSLSMKIDMKEGLGLSKDEQGDPFSCYYVAVNYKDGTKYVVKEQNTSKHTCDTEINNTGYSCGTLTDEYILVFNRLVDPEEVASITVNEVTYQCQ